MPTTRDYYEILSIERSADLDEIKRAYRRLAMKHHPDRNPGDAAAEVAFKECAEAYEVLSDPAMRRRYDQFGHEGVRSEGGRATHDFSRMNVQDIFSMFNDIFGGLGGGNGAGRAPRGQTKGFDLEAEVSLTLEEVAAGAEKPLEFTRLDACEKCHGSGAKAGSKPVTCPTCAGQGKVQQSGFGGMFRMVTACPSCAGRGKVIKEFCDACRGKGRLPKARKLSIRIPPGIADGQAVRIRGEGEAPPPSAGDAQGERGDLYVVVRVREHDLFQRDGDNLILRIPVSFTQASLGAEVKVPTIDGERAPLTVPRGTQHGATFRLPQQGLPAGGRAGRRGDLVVVAQIEIPTRLSKDQERLLREFAQTENESVLPESTGFWKKIFGGDRGGKP